MSATLVPVLGLCMLNPEASGKCSEHASCGVAPDGVSTYPALGMPQGVLGYHDAWICEAAGEEVDFRSLFDPL